jgi:YVTN family beta-propeller protein
MIQRKHPQNLLKQNQPVFVDLSGIFSLYPLRNQRITDMKNTLLCLAILAFTGVLTAQTLGEIESNRVTLSNGWSITPVGETIPLGDLPLNMALSSSGELLAVTNNGQSTQQVMLLDGKDFTLLDSVEMGKSWVGLVFSGDGRSLYASGGNDNWIVRFSIENKRLIPADTFRLGKPWPQRIWVAGIQVDEKRQLLYAVTTEDHSLYIYNLKKEKTVRQLSLGGEGYTCLLSPDGEELYVSCWGCDQVAVLDTRKQKFTAFIPVGDNPNDMCLTRDGRYLFVANSNDNSVSVIDLASRKVVEVLNAALYPGSPSGSTSNSVALGDDDRRLYVANADNNCLAVFDVEEPGSSAGMGFIPTGWYPTCVRLAEDKILVSNGKGNTNVVNPHGPNPYRRGEEVVYQQGGETTTMQVQYIAGMFRGTMQVVDVPGPEQAGIYSQAVYNNTPFRPGNGKVMDVDPAIPIPLQVGEASPIHYVFYIIKENRTYDQVLGDMPGGNGDTSLVLFGKEITPNQHALAEEFVLLDNFYVDSEVSADGHNWSVGAYATDYLEKTWPTSYGGRGGAYSGEGNREIANNRDGFIWDFCNRHGVSFRTYGEFTSGDQPNIPVLEGHLCPWFTGWNMGVRDTVRFYQWKRDFDLLLQTNSVPQLTTLRFPNDHTEGLNVGRPTPNAHVADNDLAVGLFVEYLSRSPIWKESVVFILEDDAQNGPDHVDAHRSTAFLAGGFVKQGYVDHTMYSTTSVLRTIELILGLPPMTQYDAAATPMHACFDTEPGHPPFTARAIHVDLGEKNTEVSAYSELSEKFDFSKEDSAPDNSFSEVIWKAVKGIDSPCPSPVRAAFVASAEDED